ncbi:MAG TPA: hypothetical protein VN962_20065 [Polyangia bacterium]|nr:hypothetical protein [Polyangia bacterium]
MARTTMTRTDRGRHLCAGVTLLAALAAAASAHATPRPLPFTYIYETLPAGEAEIELYTDVTPLRLVDPSANPAMHLVPQYQVEIEYGLTDRLELGLYLVYAPTDLSGFLYAPHMTEGSGIKQRLRYRFADAGQWPVDTAVYGELVENDHEIELEAKVILQRRVGPFRIAANAWAELEYEWAGSEKALVVNPTAGVVLEKWVTVQPGIEYWMHGEYVNGPGWVIKPTHYVGPTVMLQFGKVWWSSGVYLRASGLETPAIGSGDPLGAVWARTIVGISY